MPIPLSLLCAASLLNDSPTQKIDKAVAGFVAKHLFNGNVLVTKKGKTIFQKSYGMANMEWRIPNSADTRFRIGSVSKQFAAMLIMQLRQEGKLDLNAKVTDYLPWYRKDTGSKITVHNLLTHSAGIPNFTTVESFVDIDNHDYTRQQVAEKYCSGDLEFEPGSKFKYNNSDYYLLGMIIEVVTKKTFTQVLQERILNVIGMRNTGVDTAYSLLEKRAVGYTFEDGVYKNVQSINPDTVVYTAGAMYSTVGDLALWQAALYSNKLLNKENSDLMFKPFKGKYAYGVYVNDFTPKGLKTQVTAIGHNGGIRGFSTSLIRFVQDDMDIILTDNSTTHTRGNIEEITIAIYLAIKGGDR